MIVIVGGGVLGLTAASKLCSTEKLLLLDQGKILNGSTKASAGMIRVFHKTLENVELALTSLRVLSRSPDFLPQGALSLLPHREKAYAEKVSRLLTQKDYPHFILSRGEIEQQFDLSTREGEFGVYEPQAGTLNPSSYCSSLQAKLHQEGVSIRENTEVLEIIQENGKVSGVRTPLGRIPCSRVLLAPGAASPTLLQSLGLEKRGQLREIKAHSVYFEKNVPNLFDYSNRFYLGHTGSNRFISGLADSPDWPSVQNELRKRVKVEAKYGEEVSARDRYFPNQSGMVGSVCGQQGLYIMTGWGGGAFKFSDALGEKVKELIQKDFSS